MIGRGSSRYGVLAAGIAEFQRSAMAPNTGLAYRSDWRQFERWCRLRDVPTPPAAPGLSNAVVAMISKAGTTGTELSSS